MNQKKLKITIEIEGKPAKVLMADGMAAALIGHSEDTSEIGAVVCGHLGIQEWLKLLNGVEEELPEVVSNAIIKQIPASEILKILKEDRKHESEG